MTILDPTKVTNSKVFSIDSIDEFVTEGMTKAAKEAGLGDFSELRESYETNSDKNVLWTFIENGNPIAYLIQTVSNSFKSYFPSERISSYILNNKFEDILSVIETGRKYIASEEYTKALKKPFSRKIKVPILREVADFFMISKNISPQFLKKIKEQYSLSDLDYKTATYYGQSSIDIKRENRDQLQQNFIDLVGFEFTGDNFMEIVEKINQELIFDKDLSNIYNDLKIIAHADLGLEKEKANKIVCSLDKLYANQRRKEGVAKAVKEIAHNLEVYQDTMSLFKINYLN